jgi:hypothetical protein
MTKRIFMLLVLTCTLFSSCSEFFKDDYQIDEPSSKRINIPFPSLVTFEIIQTVTPDRQGLTNEISNTYLIKNELNQPISQLKFGINIFDSTDRFQKNLVVSYVDSIKQTLGGFGQTTEKLFNTSFGDALNEDMIDIFILEQDVLDTHTSNGIYVGEASFYTEQDSTPVNIPFVFGTIDYKGDLELRASGNEISDYNISGRLSASGQFIGQYTSSASDAVQSLKNKINTTIGLQGTSLEMILVPKNSTGAILDSITVVLNRN